MTITHMASEGTGVVGCADGGRVPGCRASFGAMGIDDGRECVGNGAVSKFLGGVSGIGVALDES